MMYPNRSIEPDLILPDKLVLPRVIIEKLSNDVPVYLIKDDGQELLRLEFIFQAGKWFEHKSLVASTTNTIMNEGTLRFNSQQLAEGLDYYGSFLQLFSEHDRAGLVLFCLPKYLKNSLEYVEEIIKSSIFPEKEIDVHLNKARQQYLINNQKVSFLARKEFNTKIFGIKHPYGNPVEAEDFENIARKDLQSHYKNYYSKKGLVISVAGNWDFNVKNILDSYFGQKNWGRSELNKESRKSNVVQSNPGLHIVSKKDALQSAIRIGKKSINRRHPDYTGLSILTVILGGYFGSRLMKNIREDKAYTYGIGAQLVSLENSGFLVIVSEVGAEVCKNAIEEIFKEIALLRTKTVGQEELRLVKNYILGNWLRLFDGPLATAEAYRILIDYGLDENYFFKAYKILQDITPETLQELAVTYLEEENFVQVVAGIY